MTTNKQDEPLIKLRFPGLPVRQLAGNDLAIDADKLEEYINSEVLSVLDELDRANNISDYAVGKAIRSLKEKYK